MKLVPIIILLVGCEMVGGNVFSSEPFADTKKDKDGNVILLDTPRMWNDFRETVDFRIANEKSGRRPEAGKKSWVDFWVWQIQSNATGRENHKKYANYIIERRRQEGLPELAIHDT